jgi:hypothetical protein
MDQNCITNVFVAKDIARTSTPQITAPGTTATYIHDGEIFVVQESTCLVAADTPVKNLPISFVMKSSDGLRISSSQPIYGGDVKRISLLPYSAPVEQSAALMITDAVLENTNYIVRVVLTKPEDNHSRTPNFILGSYLTGTTTTKAALVAGLAASLNLKVTNDPIWSNITFSAGGTNSDVLIATSTASSFYDPAKFPYQQKRFTMQLVNYNYTYDDNLGAAMSLGGATATQCTMGSGSYSDVKDMEWFAVNNQSLYKGKEFNQSFEVTPLGLNVESGKTYDKIVIDIEVNGGTISGDTKLKSNVVLCLPISSVGSEQTADIIAVLNKYFYTAWGLTQITGS